MLESGGERYGAAGEEEQHDEENSHCASTVEDGGWLMMA